MNELSRNTNRFTRGMLKGPRTRDMLMDGVEPDSPTMAITIPDWEQLWSLPGLNSGSWPLESWKARRTATGTEAHES